jgi:hypothetical protein
MATMHFLGLDPIGGKKPTGIPRGFLLELV